MISLMDIANARLEAITYHRVEETLKARRDKAGQRLYNLAAIAAYRGHFTVEDLKGPGRTQPLAWARQDFMLAASEAGFNDCQIGRFINRDHTTVRHGKAAAAKRRAQ
jgi:chromosomal replication initiation ATPase DnaA